jgi:hydrogenase nickel incorporation protein HypB
MLSIMPFDIQHFRDHVRGINPNAKILELSTLSGKGLNEWLDWLGRLLGEMGHSR